MKSIIADLSESKLYPSRQSLKKETADSLSEATYVMLMAMRVLVWEDSTSKWAKSYLKKTYRQDYDSWRSDANDLYVSLYALSQGEYGDGGKRKTDMTLINRWMKAVMNHTTSEDDLRRLFLRMDALLHVKSSTLRSLRRDVMGYPDLSKEEQENVIVRLINKVRTKTSWLELSRKLRTIKVEMDELTENATSGATGSASIATVAGGLGSGFDPSGHKGVYEPSTKKKKKPLLLRR